MKRRDFLKTAGAAAAASGVTNRVMAQGASEFPTRPITMMIAFPPGGSGDLGWSRTRLPDLVPRSNQRMRISPPGTSVSKRHKRPPSIAAA